MAGTRVEAEFGSGIDAVWEVVGDFGGLVTFLGWPPVMAGEGIGSTRTMGEGPTAAIERLVEWDEDAHRISYVLEQGPLPVSGYRATMHLSPLGEDRTALVWTSTYEPVGMSAEEAEQAVERLYRYVVGKLQERYGS